MPMVKDIEGIAQVVEDTAEAVEGIAEVVVEVIIIGDIAEDEI